MADDCILCGKCLEACPLLRATGREELSPRGKADLYRLLSGDEAALSSKSAARLAGLCLGCQRCVEACPQSVDVPGMVAALRGEHPNFKSWLWKTWLTKADTLWKTSGRLAKVMPKSVPSESFGSLLKLLAGMREESDMSPFVKVETFPDTYRGQQMLLFAGCMANNMKQDWLATAHRLLDELGVEILPDDFTCCGGGLRTAGFSGEAGSVAAANIEVWRSAGKPQVVTFCASCLASLREYSEYFQDRVEAQQWRDSLVPLAGMLHGATFSLGAGASERIGYHHPCHAGLSDPDFGLLSHVLSGRLTVATSRECCGFGGVMQLGAPELAEKVNAQCRDILMQTETVVTGCSACVAQLSATLGASVVVGHWLEGIEHG